MRSGGLPLAAVAMTIVGSSVAVSGALTDYPFFSGQFVRYAVGTAVLGVLLRRSRTRAPRLSTVQVGRLLALAVLGLVGFNLCLVRGAEYADPAVVGVAVGVTPLALAVLGPVLEGRRPSTRVLAAAAVVVSGATLVQGFGHTTPRGSAYALGALVGEVLFSLLAASLLPALGALRLSTWVCATVLPVLAVASLVTREQLRFPDLGEAAALLWIALAVTVGAFLAWYSAIRALGVERLAVFPGLIPVSALVCTAVIGTGRPTVVEVVGAVVVAGGVVAGARTGTRPPPATVPA